MQANRNIAAVVAFVAAVVVLGAVVLNASMKTSLRLQVTQPQVKPTAPGEVTPYESRHKLPDAAKHQPSYAIPQLAVEQPHAWYVRSTAQKVYWNKIVTIIGRNVAEREMAMRVEQSYEDKCGQLRVSATALLSTDEDRTLKPQVLAIITDAAIAHSELLDELLGAEVAFSIRRNIPSNGWLYACLGDLQNFERYKELAAAEDAALPIVP